jgi:septal ring factor EnvC (AmiA/AmiB activator)
MQQLKALDVQMNSRKKLIDNLKSEVNLNNKIIDENLSRIESLKSKYKSLEGQYSSILRASYLRKQTNSKWSYLLSAENLNNFILRWRYINQFDNYTKQKMEEINMISLEVKTKNEEVLKVKEKTISTLNETTKNIVSLEKEQKEKDQLVKKLSKEEANLQVSLKKRERERENLNHAIEKVIIAELSKAKEKEKESPKAVKKTEIDNSDFSKNKGALSWPVSKGFISGRFGTHAHPVIKNVQVSNNGVDFTLPSSDDVKCIYDGVIVGITTIPGFKNMVIIKHGSYYSVYSKLDETNISKDQKIKRGQVIGKVFADGNGQAEIHFELWKDKVKLNPESWFSR